MRQSKRHKASAFLIAIAALSFFVQVSIYAQERSAESKESQKLSENSQRGVRAVTIPVTPRPRSAKGAEELFMIGNLMVREDGEPQNVLSIRPIGTSPLSLAVLIQDDLVSSVANEIKPVAEFIRRLPKGSRIFVGYIRSGSLDVRQKFTTDTERAASTLRSPIASASAAPFNPYVEIIDALKRFDALPTGRRAMLVVSDGLDLRNGLDSTSPAQSTDLHRAVSEAQRRAVAIYSIYAPTVTVTGLRNSFLELDGQSSLGVLSDETGGRVFNHGLTGAPVSFDPFLKELVQSLSKQIALTYLSTHPKKGFHKIEVRSDAPGVTIDYPAGHTH